MNPDKNYHILIVDDQPDNVFLLEMLLSRQQNFKVSSVGDGQQALDFIDQNEVDAVLMDVMMPVMDGNTATQKIRERFSLSELPIIMVTTLSDTRNLVKSFEAGANDFVSKPIEWEVLKVRLVSGLRVRDALQREKELHEKTQILNKRLKQFSFSIAHDIRNPLAHIKVLCGASADGVLPENFAIPQISELSERAYTFLDSILEHAAYGKVEQDEAVDIKVLLEDVVKFLGASVEEKSAEITFGSLPKLKGSYGLLFQLFLNLVGNAIKYAAPERNPVVHITELHDPKLQIISVKDNGAGIADEDLKNILEPLTRGKSSEGTEGSGLGLSLANNIMVEYEGDIKVESECGVGTEMLLRFPKSMRIA